MSKQEIRQTTLTRQAAVYLYRAAAAEARGDLKAAAIWARGARFCMYRANQR